MINKIIESVKEKIDSIAYGNVFSVCDFPVDVTKQKPVKETIPKQMAGIEKEDLF